VLILHVVTPAIWEGGQTADATYRPPSLDEVGFIYGCRIHFATLVANAVFRGEERLLVVGIDSRRLVGVPVAWDGPDEQPRLWPNIGGALPLDAVVAVVDWWKEGDAFPRVPAEIRAIDLGPDPEATFVAAEDVADVVGRLDAAGLRVVVEGGWAVDALVGRQSRPHGDLDVAVDAGRLEEVAAVIGSMGYELVVDQQPMRLLFRDGDGRKLDVHPRDLDGHWYAGVTTVGTIGGAPVVCLEPHRQIEQHGGYEPGENDYLDLEVLSALVSGRRVDGVHSAEDLRRDDAGSAPHTPPA
jgi:lincosamide nucleotidyltransferase A/C/D/E